MTELGGDTGKSEDSGDQFYQLQRRGTGKSGGPA